MYVFMNAVCTTFLNGNNVVYMVRAFKSKEQQVKLTAYGSFFTMGAGLAGKIGSAFGGFILGILMSLSGYDGTAAVQTDAALLMIRMLASIVPLIIFAVIILLLRKYSLDEEMQAVRNAAKEGEQS